ncbi:23S rRNA (pseudouridine(1915)-N(3))-methyltransferase RlmH [Enteractinococcus coprophilus]|uniref:Ribosomal RNA large subunit methyltransferase H n=2 Tax=Enteractinococcus coprophilus TaxID=1027633 RepID=A0A543AFW3_9MICC|nr:23S rRNA (pseudouridine1915-N3)-methyltransferase [Enteractinococcus coprophilus]
MRSDERQMRSAGSVVLAIRVITVGKRHEAWVSEGIERFLKRLKKPYDTQFVFVPHATATEQRSRQEESAAIEKQLRPSDYVILLDERGKDFTSPQLARHLQQLFDTARHPTFIIGGAYGVNDQLRARANTVWSLSNLVFPHQLVRLLVVEQVYRAQEISAGRPYHHQ